MVLFAMLMLASVFAEDYNRKCSSIRVGTKSGATDVMLDGEATEKFKQYKYVKDENDINLSANENESKLFVHGIKLSGDLRVNADVSKSRLLTATASVSAVEGNKEKFEVTVSYKCTEGLTGISDVYLSFYLDDNICSENKIGIKKK